MSYLLLNSVIMSNIYFRTFDQYDDNLICTDNGKFERYCPNNEFPLSNKKYFPFEFVVHENYKISPKYYYDSDNNIKIVFKTLYEYDILEDVYKLYVIVTPIKNNDMFIYSSIVIVLILFWSIYLLHIKQYIIFMYMIFIIMFAYDYNFKGEYGYFM